jgi:uncharacterized membrane-anchored protein
MATKILAAALAVALITAGFAQAATDAGQDAKFREIAAMHWQPGPVELPSSHSKVATLGYKIITGTDAHRYRELADPTPSTAVEAAAVNFNSGDEIVYQYFDEGYVSINDWADINPDTLLAELKRNTEVTNKARRERGDPELHVSGWVEKPSLNRDTNTVSWIFSATRSDGAQLINAVALKLGRNGYEKIIWITDPASSMDGFRIAINGHQFEPGYRYSDHVTTDRSAAYGVAGLVAGVLGVKALKVAAGAGLFAALASSGKALGALIILPFVALWGLVKRLFRRREAGMP